jgi:tetratricopeptide (TPR) repeat protein
MREGRILACAFALVLAVAGAAGAPAHADPEIGRLIDQNHWKRARARLETALEAHPGDPALVRQQAQVLHAFDDLPGALAQAERAVQLAPNDAEAHFVLAEVVGDMAQNAGVLKRIGLAKRFKNEAEQAITLDPRHVEARLDLMSFYVQAPGIAGGDKKKARALVDEIERIDPGQAWRAKARWASLTKDTTAIGGIYRDAAAQQPDDYQARIGYASVLAAPWRRQGAAAESEARAALALDPERTEAYAVLAVLAAHEQRWDDLDRVLADAEAKVPDDLTPTYQAGRVSLTEHGDGARAERYFRRYLSQPAEAGKVPLAAAHWRLGLALEKQGKRDAAIEEIRLANQLDPKFEPAKKDLKRLKG